MILVGYKLQSIVLDSSRTSKNMDGLHTWNWNYKVKKMAWV